MDIKGSLGPEGTRKIVTISLLELSADPQLSCRLANQRSSKVVYIL